MHEVDGHELDGSESAVDPTDELVDRRSQVLVLLNVLTRGNGELNEDDLSEAKAVETVEDRRVSDREGLQGFGEKGERKRD